MSDFFCQQCGHERERGQWRLVRGHRETSKDNDPSPQIKVCSICVKRIPKHARRKTMGTLGARNGRVYFLQKQRLAGGGRVGYDSTEYMPVSHNIFYIAHKHLVRFLPRAIRVARGNKVGRLRKKFLGEEIT